VIGTDIVAKSAPDGHTLLIVTTGFTTNAFLRSKLPYRTPEDFEPVTPVGTTPVVLVAHPSLPVKTGQDLVALAKARPGEIVFASSGAGSGGHLTMVLLQRVAGIEFNHVPYKGAGASTAAVVSGEAKLLFTAISAALPQINAGRLKPIMVTSRERVSLMPDVPTVVEAGLEGCVMEQWYGFIAPAGTPKALIDRIYADLLAVMKLPEVASKLQAAGFQLNGMPPAEFRQYLQEETKKWGAIIEQAGIGARQ
jgi:tripartite-type tricarboxylate transporter receptor subunit TctC